MDRGLSDERLAELRAMQQKRIKGRGGVPEVRDLAKALDELAEYRAREAASTWQYGYQEPEYGTVWVPCETAEEAAAYGQPGDTLVRRLVGPWEAVGGDD